MGLLDYIWGDTEEQKEARLAATPFKTKDRACTDIFCLVLYIIFLLGWMAVAVVAFLDGNPEKILFPTDSAGNICGRGDNEGKPMMFMFDITRCAGIGKALDGCPTPSICVAQCPNIEWSYTEGKLEDVRDYCYQMTDQEWNSMSIEELIQLRLCPAYLVKQKPLFDRCLPSFVNGNGKHINHDHNLTSLHDGRHSNYTIQFTSSGDDADFSIISILGTVKKSSEFNKTEKDDANATFVDAVMEWVGLGPDDPFKRRKRNVETVYTNNELNQEIDDDKSFEYEWKEEDYFNLTELCLKSPDLCKDNNGTINNTKRDLSDAIDLDTLKEGVDKLKQILDLTSLSEKLVWDLSVYWWILLLFLLLAFVLSFIWIGLLNCCAVAAVWISILGSTVCLSIALSVYAYTEYHRLQLNGGVHDDIFLTSTERIIESVTSNEYVWLSLCIFFGCLAGFLSLLLCCCFQRITIATEMIGEASHAIRDISCSLIFPLLPFILHVILVVWFLVVGSFLLSSRVEQFHVINGCEEENCTSSSGHVYQTWDTCEPETFTNCSTCPESACVFHKYGPRTLHLVLQWYNIFIFLWSIGVVSALGDITIAGAVSHWYWTFKKPSDLPPSVLRKSFKRTLKYHLGTVACGSFILAVVQLFRLMVEYVNDKVHRATSGNKCCRGMLWCLRGCFFFLEKIIKYVNRNAFIMTAMVGSGFWKSSQDAFNLITANIVRGFFVNQVTDFVMILGKIFVIGITTVCFAVAINDPRIELHYNLVPILCVIFGSYHIANTCFSVYTVAVDTLFLCFLKDVELNDGGWRKPYYMSKRLMKIMRYENI